MTHSTTTPQSPSSLMGTSQGIDRLWVVRMMALDDLGSTAALALLHEQMAFWMLKPHITGITGPRVALWTCIALVLGRGVIRCIVGVSGLLGSWSRQNAFFGSAVYLAQYTQKKSHGRLGVVSSRDFDSVPNGRGTVSILASFPNFARSGKGDSLIKAIPGRALEKTHAICFLGTYSRFINPTAPANAFPWEIDFLLHACVSSAVWVRLLFHSQIVWSQSSRDVASNSIPCHLELSNHYFPPASTNVHVSTSPCHLTSITIYSFSGTPGGQCEGGATNVCGE